MSAILLQAKALVVQQIQQAFYEGKNSYDKSSYEQMLLGILDRWVYTEETVSISNLPLLTCEATDGKPEQVVPVLAVWQLTRLAVKLFDDVEDGDISCQKAQSINVAMGLLSVAQHLLTSIPCHNKYWYQTFIGMLLRAGAGQHADLERTHGEVSQTDLEQWLAIARAKSGEFFGWAAWAGTFVANRRRERLTHFWEYGRSLGVLLQIADDFGGIWNHNDISDLATGALSLPVCYGFAVTEGRKRNHLIQLLELAKAGDTGAEKEAKQYLIDLGAQIYILAITSMEYQRAITALEKSGLLVAKHPKLVTLLRKTMSGLHLLDEARHARMYKVQS